MCVWLAVLLLPAFLSVGWHLLHGNSVRFNTYEVPVPWRYRVLNSGRDAKILHLRSAGGLDNNSASDVIIASLDLPPGRIFDMEKWKETSLRPDHRPGYRYISDRFVALDGEDGKCITFAEISHPNRVNIDCAFPNHGTYIEFDGTKSDSPDLVSIVTKIRIGK